MTRTLAVWLLLAALGAGSTLADKPRRPKPQYNWGYTFGVVAEGYPDSELNSFSRGGYLIVFWDDLGYKQAPRLGEWYLRGQIGVILESDPEVTDLARHRRSYDVRGQLLLPVLEFDKDSKSPAVLGLKSRYNFHYNSQQLEEFEHLLFAGATIGKRLSLGDDTIDLSLALGPAYSEEEKDDDWPRSQFGFGREDLTRTGLGYAWELDVRYSFPANGAQLSVNWLRYDGQWSYDDGKFYELDWVSMTAITELGSDRSFLLSRASFIRRDYELDLIGFEDNLWRLGVAFRRLF